MEGIYPLTVTLTKKEAIMRKVKLIVHETYQGKRKREDVFAAVFQMSHGDGSIDSPYTESRATRDSSADSLQCMRYTVNRRGRMARQPGKRSGSGYYHVMMRRMRF